MSEHQKDARFKELQLLAEIDRDRWVKRRYESSGGGYDRDKERQMVLSLILRELLNGPDTRSRSYKTHYTGDNIHYIAKSMEEQIHVEKVRLIEDLLSGEEVSLELGHLGRLRLFELQDQLKATRLRDTFGILFDGRYVERDLAIAIMNSRTEAPVSLAYLDMNGLKAFNEDGDHATGDAAIKVFFHAVEKAVSGAGDAYRKGGDEVVVIMPATSLKDAHKHMHAALASLAKEAIGVKGEHRPLSSSCGLVSVSKFTANTQDEIHRADLAQKKAKEASKRSDKGRRSVLIVEDEAGNTEEFIVP